MTLYLDTSVLVSALTNESSTAKVKLWLVTQELGALAVSNWGRAELSSALSIKLRDRRLDAKGRADAFATFSRLKATTLRVLDVTAPDFDNAALFADQHALGVRGGDALHLAICARHGATLCTLDQRQAEAGPALGVSTQLL